MFCPTVQVQPRSPLSTDKDLSTAAPPEGPGAALPSSSELGVPESERLPEAWPEVFAAGREDVQANLISVV